jgi:hypothetical protein
MSYFALNAKISAFAVETITTLLISWKERYNYSKKLNSLNSSVMDDKYDTYKTANIEINQ